MKLNGLFKMVIRKPNPQRFVEIDMLRGFAIILMIFGHILWDLDYFGVAPINNLVYTLLQLIVPTLFFILIGVSLVVGKKKAELKSIKKEEEYYWRLTMRGLKIFNLGMLLTVLSLIFIPGKPVVFGVLHCIGLTVVLCAPFLKYRTYNLLFALVFIFAGNLIAQYPVNNPNIFQLMVGLHQTDIWRSTVDYFPLFPWFGIGLLGTVIGDWLYSGEKRSFRMPDLSRYKPIKIFQWVGQHSLWIYLLHQPILAGILAAYLRL